MSGGNNESSGADQVAESTENFHLAVGESGDTTTVLKVASESVQDNTFDLVLNLLGQFLNTIINDRSALAVAAEFSPWLARFAQFARIANGRNGKKEVISYL